MTQSELRELREKRRKAIADLRSQNDKWAAQDGGYTAENQAEYDKRWADIEKMGAAIDREEKLAEEERKGAESLRESRVAKGPEGDPPRDGADAEARTVAFRKFLVGGLGSMSEAERRALSSGVDSQGGYLRPPKEWAEGLIKAVDDAVFIRQMATKHTVVTAASLGMTSLDADPADATWTSELGTGDEDSSMAFGARELHPYPVAKRIKVSNKLMRQVPNVESLVMQRLGYKFGITHEKAFLTGSGANRPLGVFTASSNGIPTSRDVQTGSATSITADGLKDAKYALKGNYWGRAAWMFHRDGQKIISKLKDGQNRYLWEDSIKNGEPDRLLGFPVKMSEYVPNTFTTGLYVGILGDFSYYHIADALDFTVQRLNELYAETNQTGFICRMESDGMPALAEAFVRLKTN